MIAEIPRVVRARAGVRERVVFLPEMPGLRLPQYSEIPRVGTIYATTDAGAVTRYLHRYNNSGAAKLIAHLLKEQFGGDLSLFAAEVQPDVDYVNPDESITTVPHSRDPVAGDALAEYEVAEKLASIGGRTTPRDYHLNRARKILQNLTSVEA